ncbi:MAG: hypothetical protein DSM106950_41995 [Stigonema ocellatum SAG 48.90 = DSM 106950]|nr:hypothetical protein [Stigonema ocellatum SAG 48.90 = DSM 106950]
MGLTYVRDRHLIFGVAESEYELTFFEMTKQRFFASLRLCVVLSYFKSATPDFSPLSSEMTCVRALNTSCEKLKYYKIR